MSIFSEIIEELKYNIGFRKRLMPAQKQLDTNAPRAGDMAPDFTLYDVEGKNPVGPKSGDLEGNNPHGELFCYPFDVFRGFYFFGNDSQITSVGKMFARNALWLYIGSRFYDEIPVVVSTRFK